MIRPSVRRKMGDIFSDLGKYTLTTLPITYFFSSYHEFIFGVVLSIIFIGGIFVLIGLFFISSADKAEDAMRRRSGGEHEVKLMRNTLLRVKRVE